MQDTNLKNIQLLLDKIDIHAIILQYKREYHTVHALQLVLSIINKRALK